MKTPLYTRAINAINRPFDKLYVRNIDLLLEDLMETGAEHKVLEKQRELLDNIIVQASKNVEYYRGKVHRTSPELGDFPVVTKDLFRSIGEKSFRNRNWPILPHYRMNTGGSTGAPFEFLCDSRCGLVDIVHQAAQLRRYGIQGEDLEGGLVFNGVRLADQQLKTGQIVVPRKGPPAYGRLQMSAHHLNPESALQYSNAMVRINPSFIRSYPSVLAELTRSLIAKNIKRPAHPKLILLTSETALPQDVLLIADYWGAEISFQYGHSECATFAWADKDGKYIFSPLYGHIEVLDDEGRPADKNKPGRIVVTSLHNRVRPFVRYDTGDLGVGLQKENGFYTLKKIIGRSQEFVMDKAGHRVFLTALIFGQHFDAFGRITRWRIIQTRQGRVTVEIVPMPNYTAADTSEIVAKIEGAADLHVEVSVVEDLPRTTRGKHSLLERS